VLIRIHARDLPGRACHPGPDAPDGYQNIRVGIQRRNNPHDVLRPVPGDASTASWTIEGTMKSSPEGVDITGPYIQGRPYRRFIYLSWLSDQGAGPLGMFRRAKIALDTVPQDVLEHARQGGTIAVQVQLTDPKGNPSCATVGPPSVAWQAE